MASRLLFDDLDRWATDDPEAVAVRVHRRRGDSDEVSYRELSRRSDQLALQLRALGAGPGTRVAICMTKGPDAIVAMLGAAKAGAAYVPIDRESPAARVGLILAAAEPRAVIADPDAGDVVAVASGQDRAVHCGTIAPATVDWPVGAAFTRDDVEGFDPSARADPGIGPDDLAHILFTSGSTGTPKGVMISHANVLAFVDWAVSHFGYRRDDRLSGHSPLHFDLSTFDIYGTFAVGACLHPVPPEVNVNPAHLADWIRDAELTQWFSVPSALNLMVRCDVIHDGDFPALRRLLWCGEVLPTPTLIALMKRLPHVDFTNLYGPTEATIASSWYRVPAIPADPTETIPIGRPCKGEHLVVLSADGTETPTDRVGDLHIEGVGLSSGYWRDEERTEAAFRTDLVPGRRLYRTGDLATRRSDGELTFVGRTDSQIKSRGHRIELGEVEAALQTVSGLDESAVVAIESGGFEGMAICAGYVPAADGCEPVAIANELTTLLPRYMVPQRWLRLDALPRNVNGKVDRPSLRAAFEHQGRERRR